MSSYTLEKLAGEPIILGITENTWVAGTDIPLWAEDLRRLLDNAGGPVYYVGDITRGARWTVEEAIMTANALTRGEQPVFRHPNLKGILIVTEDSFIRLAGKGLENEIFGNVRIRFFATSEEALAFARSH